MELVLHLEPRLETPKIDPTPIAPTPNGGGGDANDLSYLIFMVIMMLQSLNGMGGAIGNVVNSHAKKATGMSQAENSVLQADEEAIQKEASSGDDANTKSTMVTSLSSKLNTDRTVWDSKVAQAQTLMQNWQQKSQGVAGSQSTIIQLAQQIFAIFNVVKK